MRSDSPELTSDAIRARHGAGVRSPPSALVTGPSMGKGDFAAARKLLHDNLSFHGPIETFDVKKTGEGAMHTGVDLSAAPRTHVPAAADGIVTHASWGGQYGSIVVNHGKGLQTWYAHLSRFEVVPGQEIRRGEVIGRSGATGRVTAPHLHYEVRVGGTPINPYKYLTTSLTAQPAPVQEDLPF